MADLAFQLSPLQLEGYYVREFSFAARPGLDEQIPLAMQTGLHIQPESLFDPDEITVNVKAGGGVHKEDLSRFVATIEVETRNPPERKVPYDFHAVLVGYFYMNVDNPTEYLSNGNLSAAVRISAASLLYSAAREFVAVVTGRGLFPAMILPSLSIRPEADTKQGALSPAKEAGKKGRKKSVKKSIARRTSKKSG